jgi:hypothetical protein
MALSSGKAEERGVHVVLETSLLLVQLELCQQLLQRRDLQLHLPHLVVQVTTTSIVSCCVGWTFSATWGSENNHYLLSSAPEEEPPHVVFQVTITYLLSCSRGKTSSCMCPNWFRLPSSALSAAAEEGTVDNVVVQVATT